MAASIDLITSITDTLSAEQIGKKSWNLRKLLESGFPIPKSYCMTKEGYELFVKRNNLQSKIEIELGRKSLSSMRWEEIWDCGLRIRNLFFHADIPEEIVSSLEKLLSKEHLTSNLAIRSSSTHEDMKNASFAGLYDSYLNCENISSIVLAVRKVWTSLWSDRSLLYRNEIKLDPLSSAMPVLIQEMVIGEFSGVAFSRDPNDSKSSHMVIEVVTGLCEGLVDGSVEPNRLNIDRETNSIVNCDKKRTELLLTESRYEELSSEILNIESAFGCPVDIEWTMKNDKLIVLQTRPINYSSDSNKKRLWYLTLTPKEEQLSKLMNEVNDILIPALRNDSDKFKRIKLAAMNNEEVIVTLYKIQESVKKWRVIYTEKFIPFAHGVRQFAEYYNDMVKPDNTYQFVKLLQESKRIANKRHKYMQLLSDEFNVNMVLKKTLEEWFISEKKTLQEADYNKIVRSSSLELVQKYKVFKRSYFDITFEHQRWLERDDIILPLILNYKHAKHCMNDESAVILEAQYLSKSADESYAKHILEVGRLSWSLRDDDNLLLSNLESHLLYAIEDAQKRIKTISDLHIRENIAKAIQDVSESSQESLVPTSLTRNDKRLSESGLKARQLKGQPAVPGVASGYARCIKNLEDIKHFQPGEIILCDAIDPTMTSIVPLAKAVIERRGGMLIHGVIIARELGIPCVNGLDNLFDYVDNGHFITVDGDMGLVIVGEADITF